MLGIALSAAALILAGAVLVPALLGFQRYVITSGSMTGTYDRGSLVFDRVVPTARLRAGDVITFRPPGHPAFVTHRIASCGPSAASASSPPRATPTAPPTRGARSRWATPARRAWPSTFPTSATPSPTLSERKVRMIVIGLPALLIALAAMAGLRATPPPSRGPTQPA